MIKVCDKCGKPNPLKVMEKKKIHCFTISPRINDNLPSLINLKLDVLGVDANDVVGITHFYRGPYNDYTVWYKE